MGYELHRFAWWLSHDSNAPSVFVQATCSACTMVITAALCRVTYRYMQLTRALSQTAAAQLRAAVRPIIAVRFSFGGGQDSCGGVSFTNQVYITIINTGSNPLIIKKATIRWEHSPQSEPLEKEVAGFKAVVISSQKEASDRFLMRIDGTDPCGSQFPVLVRFCSVKSCVFRPWRTSRAGVLL